MSYSALIRIGVLKPFAIRDPFKCTKTPTYSLIFKADIYMLKNYSNVRQICMCIAFIQTSNIYEFYTSKPAILSEANLLFISFQITKVSSNKCHLIHGNLVFMQKPVTWEKLWTKTTVMTPRQHGSAADRNPRLCVCSHNFFFQGPHTSLKPWLSQLAARCE